MRGNESLPQLGLSLAIRLPLCQLSSLLRSTRPLSYVLRVTARSVIAQQRRVAARASGCTGAPRMQQIMHAATYLQHQWVSLLATAPSSAAARIAFDVCRLQISVSPNPGDDITPGGGLTTIYTVNVITLGIAEANLSHLAYVEVRCSASVRSRAGGRDDRLTGGRCCCCGHPNYCCNHHHRSCAACVLLLFSGADGQRGR